MAKRHRGPTPRQCGARAQTSGYRRWRRSRVYGDALAAGHVANDLLAANRITTAGAIDHQVVVSFDLDGRVVAAKDAPHDTGEAVFELSAVGAGAGRRRTASSSAGTRRARMCARKTCHNRWRPSNRQDLASRLAEQTRISSASFMRLHGDAVLARFLFHKLACRFRRRCSRWCNVEPVLDFWRAREN